MSGAETDHMSEAEFIRFAAKRSRPRRMGYRAALRWIVENEAAPETLDRGSTHTMRFCAAIFGVSVRKVTTDLRILRNRQCGKREK